MPDDKITLTKLAAEVMGRCPKSWSPTESIADVWILVSRMRELGLYLNYYEREGDDRHRAAFYEAGTTWDCMAWGPRCDNAPEAITRAAVAAWEKR